MKDAKGHGSERGAHSEGVNTVGMSRSEFASLPRHIAEQGMFLQYAKMTGDYDGAEKAYRNGETWKSFSKRMQGK